MATASEHHTPCTLLKDLTKYKDAALLPALPMKPAFQAEIELECAALKGITRAVTQLGDCYVL